MSDASMDRNPVSIANGGEAITYRAVFGVLFISSALALTASRLVGRSAKGSIWAQAKQAAHATAGYAVKY